MVGSGTLVVTSSRSALFDQIKEITVILRFPKMPPPRPFARTRQWKTVFVLFRVVTLQDDHRRHILICQTVRRRYSPTFRKWLWASLS